MLVDRPGAVLGAANILVCLGMLAAAPALRWELWPITAVCAGLHAAYNCLAYGVFRGRWCSGGSGSSGGSEAAASTAPAQAQATAAEPGASGASGASEASALQQQQRRPNGLPLAPAAPPVPADAAGAAAECELAVCCPQPLQQQQQQQQLDAFVSIEEGGSSHNKGGSTAAHGVGSKQPPACSVDACGLHNRHRQEQQQEGEAAGAASDDGDGGSCSLQPPPPPSFWRAVWALPWEVVPFVLGMFCVVEGLNANGWLQRMAAWLGGALHGSLWAALFGVGGLSLLLANIINNQPMTILMARVCMHPSFTAALLASGGGAGGAGGGAVQDAPAAGAAAAGPAAPPPAAAVASAFAVVIASNTAANFSVMGALAGIMFLNILRRRGGAALGYVGFTRLMAPAGAVATVAALVVLGAEFAGGAWAL
jgi:hypothetical protein